MTDWHRTHTKKERKYQERLQRRIDKRLSDNKNTSFENAFKHVIMQELIKLQDQIDELKGELNAIKKNNSEETPTT